MTVIGLHPARIEPRMGVRILHSSEVTPCESERLREATIAAFPEYRFAEYFARRGDVFGGADHTIVAFGGAGDRLAGVLVAQCRTLPSGRPLLHLQMNLLAATFRRTGLLLSMWRVLVEKALLGDPSSFPTLWAVKTYNPVVYSSLLTVRRGTAGRLYPRLDRPQEPDLTALACEVAATLCPDLHFIPETGVLEGAGTPVDFYAAMPSTNRRPVHEYFLAHVRPGDRMLCLVEVPRGGGIDGLLRHLHIARPMLGDSSEEHHGR
jgi:hypothetical protein